MTFESFFINKIIQGDCTQTMKDFPDNSIDMIITSPPYGDEGKKAYNFFTYAKQIYRILKPHAVFCLLKTEGIKDGGWSGENFSRILYLMSLGFKLNDTIIWDKETIYKISHPGITTTRYNRIYDFIFVLCKGKVKIFNPIKDRNGDKLRSNIWRCNPHGENAYPGCQGATPPVLVKNLMTSWSNENSLILDPMCGSGTVCQVAKENSRNYIGIEFEKKRADMAKKRLLNKEKIQYGKITGSG